MSTVYHLADEHLQLTHYCSMRNQPRLRATRLSPDGTTFEFELLDVGNLSRSGVRYTHRMRVVLEGPDEVSVTYVGRIDGEEAGELTVELQRLD